MKAKYLILSVLAAGAAFLFGCTKEPVTGYDSSVFKVSSSYVQMDTLGGDSKITLNATEDWKLFVKTSYEYKDADGKTKTVDTLIVPGTSVKPRGIKDAVESWVTVTPLEGAAGEHEITFTAPAGSQYRTQDVRIIGENGSIVVTLAQGENIVITYKASEARDLILAGKHSGSPVLVKGIICKIDEISTSYGNATYYLSDDGTYKGDYDADDPSKNDGNWLEVYRGYWKEGEKFTKGDEIAVGDEVTIKAVLTLYKGIPETNQGTAEVVEIKKSLVAVTPANIEVGPEGGVVEVAVLYNGTNLTFDLDTSAVKFVSIVGSYAKEDTTFVKLRVDENTGDKPRSGVVSFTSTKPNDEDPKKTDSSIATVTVSQGIYAVESIAELSSAFTSTSDQTFNADFANPAVVTYVNGSNVFFADETGGILYYKPGDDANTYTAGTTISGAFNGKGKLFSGLPELTLISGGTLGTAAVPEVKVVTLAELNANYNKYLSVPVKVEGITVVGSADGSAEVNVNIEQDGTTMILRTQDKTIVLAKNTVGDAIVIPTLYNTTKQLGLWEQDHFTSTVKAPIVAAGWDEVEAEGAVKFFQYWTTGDWSNPKVPATDAGSFDNISFEEGVYTYDISDGAPDLWMAQLFIRPNPEKATLPIKAGKNYHISITIESTAAFSPWVKFTQYVAEPNNDPASEAYIKHEGACLKEWGNIPVAAGTPTTFEYVVAGQDFDNVNWTLGLGGHAGAVIKISGIKVEETDAAAGPIMKVDGTFADWAGITAGATGSRLAEIKTWSDGTKLYIYQKWDNATCQYGNWSSYQFLYFDTDNDSETGDSNTSNWRKGTEVYWKFFFHFEVNGSNKGYNISEYRKWDGSAWSGSNSDFAAGQEYRGVDSDAAYECEYSIPLSSLGLTAGTKCKLGILGYTNNAQGSAADFRTPLFEIQL